MEATLGVDRCPEDRSKQERTDHPSDAVERTVSTRKLALHRRIHPLGHQTLDRGAEKAHRAKNNGRCHEQLAGIDDSVCGKAKYSPDETDEYHPSLAKDPHQRPYERSLDDEIQDADDR